MNDECGIVKAKLLLDLMKEADELTAILVTSAKTIKKRKKLKCYNRVKA
jgi:hypothetical protein